MEISWVLVFFFKFSIVCSLYFKKHFFINSNKLSGRGLLLASNTSKRETKAKTILPNEVLTVIIGSFIGGIEYSFTKKSVTQSTNLS
jgi:hypothetical protein